MTVTGQQLLQVAAQYLGVPYVWGGTSMSGVDCSGLVWAVAQQLGFNIPRTSGAQYQALTHVDPSQVQIGDLVFFNADFSDGNTLQNHVGLYAGNGTVLVADHSGTTVHIVPMSSEAVVSGVARIPGVVNSGSTDNGLSGVTLSGLNSALGLNSIAAIPAARPSFDMWGALGLQDTSSASTNENYGLSAAFLESDPELSDLFSKAVAATWSQDQFIAALQETNWWQQHGAVARNLLFEKSSDPAKYNQDLANFSTKVSDQATLLGAHLSAQGLQNLASTAMLLNYSPEQINAALSKYLEMSKDGHFGGYAGQVELGIREYARDMGIPVTNDYVLSQVSGIVAGTTTLAGSRAYIQTQAELAFPAYKAQIQQGVTVGEIAVPYLSAQSRLWEIDPNKIDLQDPTLRKALTATTPDGTNAPATLSLSDFEKQLRQSPKWLSTNNAREGMLGVAHAALSDMGLMAGDLGAAPQVKANAPNANGQSKGGLAGMTNFPTLQGQSYQNPGSMPTAGAGSTSAAKLSATGLVPDNSFQPQIGGPNNK